MNLTPGLTKLINENEELRTLTRTFVEQVDPALWLGLFMAATGAAGAADTGASFLELSRALDRMIDACDAVGVGRVKEFRKLVEGVRSVAGSGADELVN